MASISVDLIVEAIGKGFDKINSNLKETGNAVEDAGGAAESGGMKFTELASALSIAKQGFDLVAQGAKFAYDNIKEGAELELARSRFDNLAGSIGTTSDALLNDMRRATNGMQSDAELIAGATDIINLGLANTQEGTVRLATAVGTLGLDMQQVVLTFANNSKARLDALGLSVEDVTKKAEELNAEGFDGDAFDEAVLIGLEEKMRLLGDASETTAGQIKILESNWKNFTDSLKQGAAETDAVSSAVEGLNRDLDIREQLLLSSAALEEFGYEGVALSKALGALGDGTIWWRNSLVDADVMARRTAVAVELLERGFKGGADELAELVIATIEERDAAILLGDTLENNDEVMLRYGESTRLTTQETEALIVAASGADAALLQNYETTASLNNKTRELEASLNESEAAMTRQEQALLRMETGAGLASGGISILRGNMSDLVGTVDRANLAMEKVLGQLDSLDGRRATATVQIDVQGRLDDFMAGNVPTPGGGGTAKGASYGDKSAGSSSSYSGSSVANPTKADHATGTDGWLTVPPGYPNDSYTVGLTSGEKYSVVNSGNSNGGGGSGGNVTINVYQRANENGRAFADRVATIVNETNGQLK